MTLKISDEARVQMPMKTVFSLIAMVAIGTWAYFGLIENQNRMSTQIEIMNKEELELELLNAVNKYNEYEGDSKMYWKGVMNTYHTILNKVFGKDWNAKILYE